MSNCDLSVFYFIKNMQKETVLRVTHSKGKAYFYAKMIFPHTSYFTRISKDEYNTINDHWSCIKDSFVTYHKNGKLYNEHCLRFKR